MFVSLFPVFPRFPSLNKIIFEKHFFLNTFLGSVAKLVECHSAISIAHHSVCLDWSGVRIQMASTFKFALKYYGAA